MNRWYSPRGARRGLLLAGLLAACWLCWAVGYTQSAARLRDAVPTAKTLVPSPDGTCCPQRPYI